MQVVNGSGKDCDIKPACAIVINYNKIIRLRFFTPEDTSATDETC